MKFQKLTPEREMTLEIYESAIDYAFSEPDIRNIAISGAYGAGKSSVIETYEEKHKETIGDVKARRFIHISLAHFDDIGVEESWDTIEAGEADKEQKRNQLEVRLEGKILNQLIHQIDPAKIPLTDFKIKGEANDESLWGYTWWIVGFGAFLHFILFNDNWCTFIKSLGDDNAVAEFLMSRQAVLFAGIALIAIGMKGIHTFLKLQTERKLLKKLIIQGNEFEILGDCKDSYFDRYLNEVMYLFENVDADAIVFEDIDRFGSNQIFEKLREINTLLSRRGNNMRFFYLLRDDIFETTDRTKFFDFIIPVVPVIDGSNAYEKMREYFDKAGILGDFNSEFLEGLSLFIDDMRVLKNIQNEFLIYQGRFKQKDIGLDWNMLLAMITYKNLFPKDFSDLQVKRGYVYTLFASKENLRKNEAERIKRRVAIIHKQIEQMDNEFCADVAELDAVFFKTNNRLRVNGKEEEDFPSRAKFVEEIKHNSNKVYYYYQYYSTNEWRVFDPKPVFEKMQSSQEYQNRKRVIEERAQNGKKRLQAEISRLEARIENIQIKSLKDLITRENQDEVFAAVYANPLGELNEFKEIKRSPYFELIQYLIKEGYIDESYADYMTYFYENSISARDKQFLRAVLGERPLAFNYQLRNPELVISKLPDHYFEAFETLNYDLLDNLLLHPAKYARKLQRYIGYLCLLEDEGFLESYLNRGKNCRVFTREMNRKWQGMADWVLASNVFEEAKLRYVMDTICISSDEDVLANNQNGVLKEYMEANIGLSDVFGEDVTRVLHCMDFLEIKIKNIDLGRVNTELFPRIYRKNMYQLNKDMVDAILECFYGYEQSDIDWDLNLTQILRDETQPLATYVKNNISEYIKVVLNIANSIEDEERVALYVLNEEYIFEVDKHKYIRKYKGVITLLEEVEDESLWSVLVEEKVIAESPKNMCDYYYKSGNELDEYLISYINESEKPLLVDNMSLDNIYGEGSKSNLFAAIIQCEEIEDEKYDKILTSFRLFYNNFPYDSLTDSKMNILIRKYIVKMSETNLKKVRENYPSCLRYFIQHNVKKYVELLEKAELFDENEFMYVMENYPTHSEETDDRIIELAVNHIACIIEEHRQINPEMLKVLLSNPEVEEGQRKIILSRQAVYMTKSLMRECLESAGLKLFLSIFEGKRPSIEVTDENKNLLMSLVENDMISSFTKDPQNEDFYKAYGKMKRRNTKEDNVVRQ